MHDYQYMKIMTATWEHDKNTQQKSELQEFT